MVFEQSWSESVTNASKMRCEKFGYKRNWSWLSFGLAKLGGLAFCALVAKLVKNWSHGVWAILVGKCYQCMHNEVWNVWLQKELILVGFWLRQLGGFAFCALQAKLVKKWNHGLWAVLVENCHKCIQNEVSNVWLRKEMILVGFWLSQVWWNGILCLGRKIGEKVKS